jgi:peptidoglycan/xylan/chitin deacetylase (PgdA/CDA1 family)
MQLRHKLARVGFSVLSGSGLHRIMAPLTRGVGAILMLHQVRPWTERGFAPNRHLEVTPEFLDDVLSAAHGAGFDLVSLDEALRRLTLTDPHPFCTVTADDGYRDNITHALPVMRRHGAPLTIYVTTGFADRTAPLWWVDLERSIATQTRIEITIGGRVVSFDCRTDGEKSAAYQGILRLLQAQPDEEARMVVADLARASGIDSRATVAELCLDWDGIVAAASDPLVTIGVHTVSHRMLSQHSAAVASEELSRSRAEIERMLGRATLPIPSAMPVLPAPGSSRWRGSSASRRPSRPGPGCYIPTMPGI